MLEQIRTGLTDYLAGLELADGTRPPVFFRRPGPGWLDGHDGLALSAYCLALEDHDARSRRPERELRLTARFLVTSWSTDDDHEAGTGAADALLGRLWKQLSLHPVAHDPDASLFIEMLQEPVSLELWRSLGLAPRPALWLRVVAVEEKPRRPVKPVEYRVFRGLDGTGTTTLSGKVTAGDENKPVAGAQVSLPELGRATRTDQLGNFIFMEVPIEPAPMVVAEHDGARVETHAEAQSDGLAAVSIHLQT